MDAKGRIALQGSSRGRSFPLLLILVAGLTTSGNFAHAADVAATCPSAIARVVSIQGSVEVLRAGQNTWSSITRLDTSVCSGDVVRTGPLSRTALFIQPETLVRVDHDTSISIDDSADATVVEFFRSESLSKTSYGRPECGAGYFITRFPKKFRVKTPFFNAAVEGTEFLVTMRCESAQLAVLEGKVRAAILPSREDKLLTSGQVLSTDGVAPAAIATLIKPTDAVQWLIYYPPLSDATAEADVPAAETCQALPASRNRVCFTQRAEALLRSGRIDAALQSIDSLIALDPASPDTQALRAIVQIANNDKLGALESATAATVADPNAYRGWLALSYAQQAAFQLDSAFASAARARTLDPKSSLLSARVAELLMSLGRNAEAEAAARSAVAANPLEARARALLGFIHLAQIDTKSARADFQTAIELDSFAPLQRLGLGLAIIRDGQLAAGRENIEIAVALDPANSLLRSYVGKAYYEENTKPRNHLAGAQFAQAKQLDPRDPTPWFYDAILDDSRTRPVEALKNLEQSTQRNDDRAVYRSTLLLDQDLAARNASQATIYNEIGFHQLGLEEAARSLAADPANTSAHRFLADIYATAPRYDIARSSELLQAQLRQPLGAPPLQAQLANDLLFKGTFFGPATVGLNEFNPLFIRNGSDLQVFGLVGGDDTYGEQAIFNALHGQVSFSLSQFAAHTDGSRPNNDDTRHQYDGYLQAQLDTDTSVQAEFTSSNRTSGDLQSSFDPTFFVENLRTKDELETQRLGLRHRVNEHDDVLISAIRQDRHATLDIDDPVFPATIVSDQVSWKAEVQYLAAREGFNVIFGANYFQGDSDEQFITPFFTDITHTEPYHINAYGYLYLPGSGRWPEFQIGAAYDDLSSEIGDQVRLNPKIGAIWRLSDRFTLRAAGFRVLKRRLNSDQGLEPTQLAGFNQFFEDDNGAAVESGGIAMDFKLSQRVSGGLQVTRRDIRTALDTGTGIIFADDKETATTGYLYWLPSDRVSVTFEPRYQDFQHGAKFDALRLTELPFALRWFAPSGLWAGLSVTGVKETGEFDGPDGVAVPGSDQFWTVDAVVAYRLPQRMGTISLQGTNLLGEKFQFQEIDPSVLPRYVPEARVFLRASLSF